MPKSLRNWHKEDESVREKLREEIEKNADKPIKDFVNAFKNIKLEKNRKKVAKCLQDFEKYLENETINIGTFKDKAKKVFECITGYKKVKIEVIKIDIPNAAITMPYSGFFLTRDKRPEITVFFTTGILKGLTPKELSAVYLHEIGHFFFMHKKVLTYARIKNVLAALGYIAALLVIILSSKHTQTEKERIEVRDLTRSIIFYFVIGLIISYALTYYMAKYGSVMETASDSYATLMGYGIYMKAALQRLYELSGVDLRKRKVPSKWIIKLVKILSRTMGIPHEPGQIRICRVLRLMLEDPSIRGTRLETQVRTEYKTFKCGEYLRHA